MEPLPLALRSTWRTVQVFKMVEGLGQGLTLFIATPYFYHIFSKIADPKDALFYTTCLVAVYFGMIAVFEIPTGAIGDTLGRVRTLLFAFLLNVVNGVLLILLFFIEHAVTIILLALLTRIAATCSYTFNSGTFSAWLVDSMRERAPEVTYDRLLARGHAMREMAMVIGGAIGITTYLWGAPYIAFLVMALLNLGGLSYCLANMEESRSLVFVEINRDLWQLLRTHTVTIIKTAVRLCYQHPLILWTTILFAGYMYVFNIVNRLWPVALGGQFGVHPWSYHWYAMVLVLPFCAAAMARLLAHRGDRAHAAQTVTPTIELTRWLLACVYCSVGAILLLGWINSRGIINFPAFLLSVVIVEASFGIVKPAFESLICHYIPPQHAQERATILSVGSALRSVLVLIFIIPSRGTSDAMSPVGWMLPATVLLVIGLVSHCAIRYHQRRSHIPSAAASPMIEKGVTYAQQLKPAE